MSKKVPIENVVEAVQIEPLRFGEMAVKLVGIAPYMQARFAQKAMLAIQAKHEAGTQANKKKNRQARDFEAEYEEAKHKFEDGTCGIPAAAFRKACISACRLVGFKMTLAKLSIFVEGDGYDCVDGTPLVKIHGDVTKTILPVRNQTGVLDLRSRPFWKEWSTEIKVRFDLSQFSATDIINLLNRAGQQVGIGEGRPDSRESDGLGYGLFRVESAS